MQNTAKIATIRGAGLAFPLASLLFVFSGQLYCFALLPAGALIGFGIGLWMVRNPRGGQDGRFKAPSAARTGAPGWLAKNLFHPNLLIRAGSMAVFGILLFLAAWYIGYYLLPDGAFRAGAAAQMARSALNTPSASVLEEWSKLFEANLLAAAILILGSLLIRVNGVSFGCLVALVNIIEYGLYLGTNSFAVSMPVRLAPSLAVLQRSGPYEMAALLVMAAATFSWSFFEIRQLFRTNPQRVLPGPKIAWAEAVAVILAVALLGAANWAEAAAVMAATSGG